MYLDGKLEISAGTYFIKEIDKDSDENKVLINGEKPESIQLLRYLKIKQTGAHVPSTFRKYKENNKAFIVMTDLTAEGKNWVWSVIDDDFPQNVQKDWINWDELSNDFALNAIRTGKSNIYLQYDAYIISVSKEHSYAYVADLDKEACFIDSEERFKGAVGSNLPRAINVLDAWKVYFNLIKKTTDEQDKNNITKRAKLFWDKVKENYSSESPQSIIIELLEKSFFSSGIDGQTQEVTRQLIEETFEAKHTLPPGSPAVR